MGPLLTIAETLRAMGLDTRQIAVVRGRWRRRELRRLQLCRNGAHHGRRERGGLCATCWGDHRTARNLASVERRERLREKNLCINGESHGAATHGCRCEHCHLVHKWGREAVVACP
jgi:hypothetical protein